MVKKVIDSRFNTPGAIKISIQDNKDVDQFVDKYSSEVGDCDERSDNRTTYVQKKVWDIKQQKYYYPPYVDCNYVE